MKSYQVFGLQLLVLILALSESLLHRRVLNEELSPETTVSSSYSTLHLSAGLHHVDNADTSISTSVLVTPELVPSEDRNPASPSTHVAYNCTSTSSIWNLQQDSNVLKLESFETLNGEFAAVANIWAVGCDELLQSSVNRVVIGNSFFGALFDSSATYFYVKSARNSTPVSTTEECHVRLEMAQATFAQVYPDCRIKFHTTDIANLIQTQSVEYVAVMEHRRKLEASSFGFVKDSNCSYDCGEESENGEIDVDKCWAKNNEKWTKVQCKVQFYEQNSKCSTECGYDDTLAPNQCYDCSSSDGPCGSGYNSTDEGCCRILKCEAVDGTAITSPGTLSWNLKDDGLTVSNSSYSIFETGNCSNTSDPSTNCCRITCENCFLNVSVASMFADVKVVGASIKEAIEMELTGNANLQVALYAPNGCTLDETTRLKNASFIIPLGSTGISIDISMGLDLRRKLSLQPHGSIATIGATTDLQSLTAGSLRSESFYDIQITHNISNKLAQSSIDLEMELELVPSFHASLSLLKGLARVGVKAEFLVFLELNSTFQFPDPFPALTSRYLDDTSLWHGGNCQLPHYMEYNCNAGYGEVNISIPLSAKIPAIGNTTKEFDVVTSSSRSSFSLFSGCVATAYDAEILLSTAINTVLSLSEKHKQALKSILAWTLGMTDIGQDFVNITSVSNTTGEIYITLSVPPSLGDIYPNAADFASEVYQRARNETFATMVSNYVGVKIGAQCDNNWWGVQCDQACSTQNCTSGNITCNAVDGAILSCGSCNVGHWGATCENVCQVPGDCANVRCNQVTGAEEECVECDEEGSCSDISAAFDQKLVNPAVFGIVGITVIVFF
ncbi:hypothetical protein L917_08420 [Phytophthora nicotianae]|uniref:EGF-like domain-containing protein n=1 Tax=Phytophthora nicotianae TaxID=4792 RepID=W2L9U0_PHYNI|nr:hypothetical protein L917_08420 [Phytophthora nicotianae]